MDAEGGKLEKWRFSKTCIEKLRVICSTKVHSAETQNASEFTYLWVRGLTQTNLFA